MSVIRQVFRFYINSSIHVALAVCAFTASTYEILNLPFAENLLFFVFGTITGYNFVKYAGIAQLHHRSLTSTLQIIQIFLCSVLRVVCIMPFSCRGMFCWHVYPWAS